MLKKDMNSLDADFDSSSSYQENIYHYEEQFASILNGADGSGNSLISFCQEVMEKESGILEPNVEYRNSPWTELDEFLDKHELENDEVRQFLKWRSKVQNGKNNKKKNSTESKTESPGLKNWRKYIKQE
ncbi:hypothetical protein OAM01_02025 [bacterium]|nr:hypothetical protein [bacterium]